MFEMKCVNAAAAINNLLEIENGQIDKKNKNL